MEGQWLRWYDQSGNWILTNQEDKLQANQRADQQQQIAEQAKQEADRQRQKNELLFAKLRELGINAGEII
jgi:hypothetical protein